MTGGIINNNKNIISALHKSYCDIKEVGKNGRNPSQGYNFRTHEDITLAVKEVFKANGIILIPKVLESKTTFTERESEYQGKKKIATIIYTEVHIEFTFYHTSGESLTAVGLGHGVDKGGDKSVYKAHTGALKYVLTQMMGITEGDDPESDNMTNSSAWG